MRRETRVPGATTSLPRGVRLLAVAAIAAACASWSFAQTPAADKPAPLGYIDAPEGDVVADAVTVTGWALDPAGVERVEVLIDGKRYTAEYGLARPDVAQAHPNYPQAPAAGFRLRAELAALPPERHELAVMVVARDGRKRVLGRRSVVPPAALAEWSRLLDASSARSARPFDFLMMTSGVAQGGAAEIDAAYRPLLSRTQRVGMAVPILYMRTTTGTNGDWTFDPAFDLARRCGERAVADDNLQGVIATAVNSSIAVQFILNGGIWGDASCESLEWDLTDHLQLDDGNVQWSHENRTFPDDYLKNLAGSTTSPLLARTLTYNVHARPVREYKRRNLQAAARIVAQFAREHPDLFVGVVLDSDTYMNPFFSERQVFDYNPGMLRQFREWLRGAGPYAGDTREDAPDLRAYRRARLLTLAQVNAIAHAAWRTWDEVQPPRRFPGAQGFPLRPGERPVWQDPWWQTWEHFRKHVVDVHYDELSQWTKEAGIPAERIYSAQGFIKPAPGLKPFALTVASTGQNYDSAGVSVEGAIPRFGHLGAVIYGPAARNEVIMETGRSMFAEFARMSPGWGVVEYNPTDLRRNTVLPTYDQAYRGLRDMFNYDASEVSAMAWNGTNGLYKGEPGYVPYTSWRNTVGEDAMRDFLVTHADVPRGAQLWTFGSAMHAQNDGWSATRGKAAPGNGYLALTPQQGRVTLLSPGDLVVRPRRIASVELRLAVGSTLAQATVYGRTRANGVWQKVGAARALDDRRAASVPLAWPPEWLARDELVQQLRLELEFAPTGSARLRRVALYPACAEIACESVMRAAPPAAAPTPGQAAAQ